MAPTITQSAAMIPVAHDQRPDTEKPAPPRGSAVPVGASGAGARYGAIGERLLLCLLAEQCGDPAVQRVETQRPGTRRASVCQASDVVEDLGGERGGFESAEPFGGDQQIQQAGVGRVPDRLGGQLP